MPATFEPTRQTQSHAVGAMKTTAATATVGQGGTAAVATRPVPSSAARPRKLHVGHFAFMRAVVQGLDVQESWDRYLRVEGKSNDERVVRATITWIREEFAAAAKREDRFSTARLVRIDATRITDLTQHLPSLDQFAEEHGLEDEPQADQIAAFEKAYGRATARQRKRAKLITRQLEALRWLEGLLAQAPRAGDAVAAWLHPSLASHLEAADIFTLAQLVERVNGIGQRWHASIKALGAHKAQRIVAWLHDIGNTQPGVAALQLGRHVALPRRKLFAHELNAIVAPASDIRPLEKFIVPAALDGSQGTYRRPQAQCLLKASNDYQAILAWIRSKHGLTPDQKTQLTARRRQLTTGIERDMDWLQALSNTQRAYRKEAERFLLWAITHKGKALSSMTNEDCTKYRDFLADPQPRSRWCGGRSRERWSPLWRPFEGPLSPSAQRHALTILKNLYGFLVDQNYLMGNPWSAVGVPRSAGPKVNAGRSFSLAQWAFIEQRLKELHDPDDAKSQKKTSTQRRIIFGLHLLYATGLRLSEVVAAKVDDLQWVEYPADAHDSEVMQGWLLKVIGKGQKEREVPVPLEVISELANYLDSRGLDLDPESAGNQGAFLLGKATDTEDRAPSLNKGRAVDPKQGIAASTFYDQIKAFFAQCADVLQKQGDQKGADRFSKASTHWMRHSHGSHAVASGMPIEIAQQNLGHASLATTTVYVTTEKRRRMKAVEAFWKG
jgi:site-specific recombinase XerD